VHFEKNNVYCEKRLFIVVRRTYMKKLIMAFWILAMLTLAACGGTSPTAAPTTAPTAEGGGEASGDGPAAAVQAYTEAIFSGDGETAASFLCEASTIEIPPPSVVEGVTVTYDFSGLTYTVSDETADSATVTVSGSYVTNTEVGGQTTPITVDLPADITYPVTNENGSWKICA
jgi:predicted small lipoprotein YifL